MNLSEDPKAEARRLLLGGISDGKSSEKREFFKRLGEGLEVVEVLRDMGSAIEGEADGHSVEPAGWVGERVGEALGGYRLLDRVGEGGFGVVYLAEQERPFKRRVALKVLKLGMDTRQIVARFELERQALAMMDHPSIAKVFDAGVTETGRPYFAMEFVEGDPITRFCESERLSISERLSLVIEVCRAVQHAHQKGVIHRDLKPSNILVGWRDGSAFPKVIDFGVAKAIQADAGSPTLATRTDQLIGTPSYMSPEQTEGRSDIDTRTDVYSLGALLFELLCGVPLYELPGPAGDVRLDLLRRIREEPSRRPSATVQKIDQETRTRLALRRRIDPDRWAGTLRGDLDWVVLKAVEKDRARRYATANALAADLTRFLREEPVSAAPPGWVYLSRKFVARHRVAVLTAAAFGVLLVACAVASTWLAIRAFRSQRLTAQTLAAMHIQRGFQADQAGKPREALVWFANAARWASSDAQLRWAVQVRAREWSKTLSWPLAATRVSESASVFFPDLVFHPRSSQFLLVHPRGGRRSFVWNLATEEQLTQFPEVGEASALQWDESAGTLVCGNEGGRVVVVSVPDFQVIQRFEVEGPVNAIACSPSGNWLAVAQEREGEGTVSLWNRAAGVLETGLNSGLREITEMRFSPDERWLLLAHGGRRLELFEWRETTGPPDLSASAPDGFDYVSPFFSGDSRYLVGPGQTTSEIGIWDLWGGFAARTFDPRVGLIRDFDPYPGGDRFLVSASGGAKCVVVDSMGEMATYPAPKSSQFLAGCVNPSGTQAVMGGTLTEACQWSISDHRLVGFPTGYVTGIRALAFSHDGRLLSAYHWDDSVIVWELPRPSAREFTISEAGPGARAVFAPDGDHLLWTYSANPEHRREVRVYSLRARGPAGCLIQVSDDLISAAFTPVDGEIVTLARDGLLTFWNWRSGALNHQIRVENPEMGLSGPLDRLAISTRDSISIVDLRAKRVMSQWVRPTGLPIAGGAWTPDGEVLLTYGLYSSGYVAWEARTGRRLYQFGAAESSRYVSVSSDGHWATCANGAVNEVFVWDPVTGRHRDNPLVHPCDTFLAKFSRGGRWLVTTARDGRIRVWDWREGLLAGGPIVAPEAVAVDFGPADRVILSCSGSGDLRVWNPGDGGGLFPTRTLRSGSQSGSSPPAGGPSLGVPPEGNYALVGTDRLRVIDLQGLEEADWTSPERLVDDAEMNSFIRIREGGRTEVMTAEEWFDRWKAWRRRYHRDKVASGSSFWRDE